LEREIGVRTGWDTCAGDGLDAERVFEIDVCASGGWEGERLDGGGASVIAEEVQLVDGRGDAQKHGEGGEGIETHGEDLKEVVDLEVVFGIRKIRDMDLD